MSGYPPTVQGVRDRVVASVRALHAGTDRTLDGWVKDRANECGDRLIAIAREAAKPPEVAIALFGGTGAGKSTLLTALLDARILPVSNMRACTAAVTEVAYNDDDRYDIQIEFVSRKSWDQEIELLRADLTDARAAEQQPDREASDGAAPQAISRAATDKLWAVYRASDTADRAAFDPFHLVEPPEIKQALDQGHQSFRCEDLKELRERVARYLDSRHRYWPIVKTVLVRGPFEALRSGAKLIDLPGINDPKEAREEVTRNHLKTCRFVWIVFSIKRVLTKDMMNLMQSDDFLRQVVMDGRAGSLTFVGTASDDIDMESAREEFHIDEAEPDERVVLARNTAVRDEIRRQLEEQAKRLASMAKESKEQAAALTRTFQASKVFTVSAKEYARLTGISLRNNPAGLATPAQTELPALRAHMEEMCAAYGIEAHAKALHRQIDRHIADLRRDLRARHVQLQRHQSESQAQRKEVDAAIDRAASFLAQQLGVARDRFAQALKSHDDLLREKLRFATYRGNQELQGTVHQWSRLHWCTLRAVVRRHGRYSSGSTGDHDFVEDLTKPVLNSIALAWADFFGNHLTVTLDERTLALTKASQEFEHQLLRDLAKAEAQRSLIEEELPRMLKSIEKSLSVQVDQAKTEMQQQIVDVQRYLYEQVGHQVQANMNPAFEQAATERGSGMKLRIIDILGRRAKEVGTAMFDEAQRDIFDGVGTLIRQLTSSYEAMSGSVTRSADIVLQNLRSAEPPTDTESAERELAWIGDALSVLEALTGEDA